MTLEQEQDYDTRLRIVRINNLGSFTIYINLINCPSDRLDDSEADSNMD